MAYTDREDKNYLGILYNIGANQTPFLNMIGGLNTGRTCTSFQFPLAQTYALTTASQNTQSEAVAAAAGTPVTYTRSQDTNTVQIQKLDAQVTYAKQASVGEIGSLSSTTDILGNQPVQDELGFQKAAAFRQLAIDIEFSFFQGAYTVPSVASTNQKTRGIEAATTTNTVDAGSADLTKALIDEVLREMAASGAAFNNMVAFVNAFQLNMLSDIYGFSPTDRYVGGVAVKTIITDFCTLSVVWAPQCTTSVVNIVDVSICAPMFLPHQVKNVGSKQLVSWNPEEQVGAKSGGFWYTMVGLDYGPEEMHGDITGLTTS